MKKKIAVKDIATFLGDSLFMTYGETADLIVDNIADVDHTVVSTLDWVNKSKDNKQQIVESSVAKVVVVDPEIVYSPTLAERGKVLLVVENPRMTIAKIATEFFLEKEVPGVHPSAIVDKGAIIDPSAHIGPGCIVGKAKIGAGTSLKAGVIVYDDVEIGTNCIIQAGVVIGTDGLGCQREADGTLVKFPHLGGVKIGDNVEVGANSQIAKGVLSDTIISNGCKMNGLCFIAHNCVLEENVWITGDTMLCGSVHVGKNTTIFSNVIVRDQAHIGEKATVGMGSVVTKNIPSGETWVGNPARKLVKQK